VTFSIADFNSQEVDPDEAAEDEALYDEDLPENTQSGGANTKGSVSHGKTKGGNIQVAPEDDIAPADRDELRNDDEAQEPSFPARAQVHITKGGKGAMTISCIVQDGDLEIEDIYFFPKAELAEAKTAEEDHARRSLYTGPPFGQLDEELQVLLENYLEERGINTAMALFIPDYIDMKEQKEYGRWLGSKSIASDIRISYTDSFARHEVLYSVRPTEILLFICTFMGDKRIRRRATHVTSSRSSEQSAN